MKKVLLLLACFLISGCMTSSLSEKTTLVALDHVKKGMLKQEVVDLLGVEVVIGYELDEKTQALSPVKVINPYRTEKIRKGDFVYDVLFFFTQIKQQDDVIADDELTPFVFRNNELVGYGWPFLNKLSRE